MSAYLVIFRSNIHKLAYRNIVFLFYIITSDNDNLSEVI